MKKITEAGDLRGKRVLVRTSLNVPVVNGEVLNGYRIKRALPTLRYLRESGAQTIIISHIGRGKEQTLKPVFEQLEKFLPIQWGGLIDSDFFKEHFDQLGNGNFLMAENLRQDAREKANDETFAKLIADFGDIYVNDDFACSHREDASMSALARQLPAYAGLNLLDEVTQLEKVVEPKSPSLFLLGGAKFETKMPLVEKYLHVYDKVFVAGALMNDVFKARGFEVGKSLVSDVSIAGASFLESEKLLLPIDVVVDGPYGVKTKKPNEVLPEESILDVGPETIEMLKPHIARAKTVLWNGPFGNYEGGFKDGTEATAKLLAEADAFCVVGGGDSVAAIENLGLNDKLGFVSTGGGAMLTFLEQGGLPVLELLE
jgi:phosphoglycerate kinase